MPGHGAVSTGEFDFGASKEREEIELEHSSSRGRDGRKARKSKYYLLLLVYSFLNSFYHKSSNRSENAFYASGLKRTCATRQEKERDDDTIQPSQAAVMPR